MRLKESYRSMIVEQVKALAGDQTQVKLFGSRVDDNSKGGDVDLLIVVPQVVSNPITLAAKISVQIMKKMNGRKIDVLLDAPNLETLPIHRIAREQGILL